MEKALQDFIQVYSSHVTSAIAERKLSKRPNGIFVNVSDYGYKIVPDMNVMVEDCMSLPGKMDMTKDGSRAALRLLNMAKEDEYGVGILWDGDCMLALTKVHKRSEL